MRSSGAGPRVQESKTRGPFLIRVNFCILRTREINPVPLMLTPARLWPFLQPAQGLRGSGGCLCLCANLREGREGQDRRQKAAPAESKGGGIAVGPGKPGERALGAPASARIPTRTGL